MCDAGEALGFAMDTVDIGGGFVSCCTGAGKLFCPNAGRGRMTHCISGIASSSFLTPGFRTVLHAYAPLQNIPARPLFHGDLALHVLTTGAQGGLGAAVPAAINAALAEHFPSPRTRVIAEPGRYMVQDIAVGIPRRSELQRQRHCRLAARWAGRERSAAVRDVKIAIALGDAL